jgi:hypothetical protein
MCRRISFLLGAGISIPANMPSVSEITQKVLSGEGVAHHSNQSYFFGPPLYGQSEDPFVQRIIGFLSRLKGEIELYYSYDQRRRPNYEDIYHITSQIYDSESGEFENPIVKPFIDKILPDIQSSLNKPSFGLNNVWEIHELADEASNYIRDIVWHLLSQRPARLDHLNSIKDACLDEDDTQVDIYTLNHDTILEQCLQQNNLTVVDGFGDPINEVRYYHSDNFNIELSNIRLFKLHGSINWILFRPDESDDWSGEKIGIPLGRDIWHTRTPEGARQWPSNGRPEFLAGTFNKMLNYTGGIYAELHYQFYQSLKLSNILIISGYGFRDRGINTMVIDWFYNNPENKIVVIHPRPTELKENARGSISNKWDHWIDAQRLLLLSNRIEETSWDDIKSILNF